MVECSKVFAKIQRGIDVIGLSEPSENILSIIVGIERGT